jgi:hypothetical protein
LRREEKARGSLDSRGLGQLLGKLEEEKHAKLLQVVAVGEPVIAQHGAVAPELLHDAIGF